MFYLFEISIALILTFIFYKFENPKLRFLFYGYVFFILTTIIQFPFKYLELYLKDWFSFALMSQVLIAPIIIGISEITKYLSLKRFLKTSSFRSGIFFGIGWTTVESINFFTVSIFTFLFSIFNTSFDYSTLLNPNYGAVNFLFFLIINLSITTFVIKAVTNKKKIFILHAIIYSLIVYYGLLLLEGLHKQTFTITILVFSTILIFFYKWIK